jgi:ABC-type branched-subunit amino acid transport system permease subunit
VLSALPEALRPVKEYSDIIYTLILLAFLIFMPKGLVTVWHAVLRRIKRSDALPAVEARP